MARDSCDLVIGLMARKRLLTDPQWAVHLCAGVKLPHQTAPGGGLTRQASFSAKITPADAIQDRGVDIIIVGRGVCIQAECGADHTDGRCADMAKEAKEYQQAGWAAYLARKASE